MFATCLRVMMWQFFNYRATQKIEYIIIRFIKADNSRHDLKGTGTVIITVDISC